MYQFTLLLIMYETEESREDGRVAGSEAYLVPWAHLENTHITATNPENSPKTGRSDFPQLIIEGRPYKKG